MWIQVRAFDGKKSLKVDGLSKLTKIEDLRSKLVEHFEAEPDCQRLFFRGKQLEDGHSLFDYNVGLNEIVQIMVRHPPKVTAEEKKECSAEESQESNKENAEPNTESKEGEPEAGGSQDSGYDEELVGTYKIGDIIDARDPTTAAWFEASIVKITRAPKTKATTDDNKAPENTVIKTEAKTETNNNVEEKMEIENKENCQDNSDAGSDKENTETNIPSVDTALTEKNAVGELDKKLALGDGIEIDSIVRLKELALENDGFIYHIKYDGRYEEDAPEELLSQNIRPRARNKIPLAKVQAGDRVMINYNYDEPDERGYWYDAIVTSKRDTRTIKELNATVFIGRDLAPLKDCKILFIYEIMAIEKPGTQLNIHLDDNAAASTPKKRSTKPECDHCKDNDRRKCKECGCHECGGKQEPNLQIMCDECDYGWHTFCLKPALQALPPDDEDWFCPLCKNDDSEIVKVGEKLKESKKKSKMASANSTSTRDWGKGMACVGKTKSCNTVPTNHFGPVPGVEVGRAWLYRIQVSETGIHRPHVAGIHGRDADGAYSIVLSGGYEDDVDDGDSFTYTGSGGRDLSGNKRTADQSCDQKLTRMNRALAKNCNAKIDEKNGAEAADWRAGKPVRVVRNAKAKKHSKYAPGEGNRYDGIYKVVKYWPSKGLSGFIVWRYMLKRDDPAPAPWTKAGKKKIAELGLEMEYPEGYDPNKEKEKKGGKRKRDSEEDSDSSSDSSPKRKKIASYKIAKDVQDLIKADTANEKYWPELKTMCKEGAQKFLQAVEDRFTCIACTEIVYEPVTTPCTHTTCKACLARSFNAGLKSCPACKTDLPSDYSKPINKKLGKILLALFPGYDSGRK